MLLPPLVPLVPVPHVVLLMRVPHAALLMRVPHAVLLRAPAPQVREDDVKDSFVVGINDDVTFSSLPVGQEPEVLPHGTTECQFW